MKLRMLSVLSIIIALSVKSLDISAKDYHNLRILAHAIPDTPYIPSIVPYQLETQLDSVVFQLAEANAITEMYLGMNDTITLQHAAFERLKLLATEEELNDLLMHKSPVVKVYAHRALVENAMNMNCDYELALLEDTTCVEWREDDLSISSTVSEMIQRPYFE